ncbi:MAG: aminoacetone oxidase family FAD-binding enzyme, partial [Vicinamibacterales bacterium]|nr:aminoacetone oxidase family FAD-binding enzyme [Vicinamibacterales bacterium]
MDVVVVGAGAAGMMCAAQAAARGRRVLLLDHWGKIGERIRISGGGRCNVTNRIVGAEHYLSRNPHYCRSALARYTPADILALLDRHGVGWEERDRGQVFCTRSAQDVVALLRRECDATGVQWANPCEVSSIERLNALPTMPSRFRLGTSCGTFECAALVVATGGLAAPPLGATPFGYRVADQFGVPVVEPAPGLVPLVFRDDDFRWAAPLSGVAFDSRTRCSDGDAPEFGGRALITHKGLSGPAILQISSYWQAASQAGPPASVTINIVPGRDVAQWLAGARQGGRSLVTVLSDVLPHRFAEAMVAAHHWPVNVAELSNQALSRVVDTLSGWTMTPSGTLGFAKAEVTIGGVDTRALSSQTMEARHVPGLYFIGEVVDVTGWL